MKTSPFESLNLLGILAIGDPHLEDKVPGWRSDDYPRTILGKLRWCLDYADSEQLLPVILGDLFQAPRNNPNWLLVELLALFHGRSVLTVVGNHDIYENTLSDHDSLRILEEAGAITLLQDAPLDLHLGGQAVRIGGTPWGQALPQQVESDGRLVAWFTHHDLHLPGFEKQAKVRPGEIAGVSLVVNGHIHKRMKPVRRGTTTWINPGNIARRERSDTTRQHRPSALVLEAEAGHWATRYIQIPHQPFEEVFHAKVQAAELEGSGFVAGLAALQSRRTESGAGLHDFLDQNLDTFRPEVAQEIRRLAQEVTHA